ncbi:type II-A CRISPR-associated protein Csn2 [bacterium]|nr:type II-A CRISPR-associated protein Csn2 [bacterium]
MKFVCPDINHVFDTEIGKVNSLIIENQKLFFEVITDISSQIEGFDGKSVLSEENKILTFSKNADLLTQFIPFDLNRKTLVNKAVSALEQVAVSGEYFQKTAEILSQLEAYLFEISANFSCDISFSKISAASIIKASGFEFKNDYDTLCEKIIDYFELVTEFDRKKLFFTVNLRSYVNDKEIELFIETVLQHGYNLLMIESGEHPLLTSEQRYIIDSALCEIC